MGGLKRLFLHTLQLFSEFSHSKQLVPQLRHVGLLISSKNPEGHLQLGLKIRLEIQVKQLS